MASELLQDFGRIAECGVDLEEGAGPAERRIIDLDLEGREARSAVEPTHRENGRRGRTRGGDEGASCGLNST